MPLDLQAFLKELKEAGSLNDDQVQNLQTILAGEATLKYLDGALLRQADYTKKTQALSETKKQYEQAIAQSEQLSEIIEEMKSRPDTSSAELKQAKADLIAMQAKAATIYNQLYQYNEGREALAEVGWDSRDKIFGGSTSTVDNSIRPPSTPTQPAFDKEALLKEAKESILKEINPYFRQLASWPLVFTAMSNKYQALTGKTLDPTEFEKVLGAKMAEMKTDDPIAAFNAAYDIPKLEKEQEFSTRLEAEKKKLREEWDREQQKQLLSKDAVASQDDDFWKLLKDGREKEKETKVDPPPNQGLLNDPSAYEDARAALAEVRGR